MANRLHNIYVKALQQAGYNLTGKERDKTLKKYWQSFRQTYKQDTGLKPPTVYDYAKQFDTDIAPTIDFGREYIADFLNRVDRIYRDTLAYIDDNKEGSHDSGKLASIASYKIDRLANSYLAITNEIKIYVDSGVPLDIIAQAIADNVELDYVIAIALQPPSDVVFLFEETLEQIKGIWTQINERVQELAEREEDSYYGR